MNALPHKKGQRETYETLRSDQPRFFCFLVSDPILVSYRVVVADGFVLLFFVDASRFLFLFLGAEDAAVI